MATTIRISYQYALRTMARVIYALMLRETKTRYGRLQVGYLWAIIEPVLFITIMGLVFKYLRLHDAMGMPLFQFLLTGFIPFMLFRDITMQGMSAVRQNQQLLYFPQVQVFDIGASRALLETVTFLIVFPFIAIMIGYLGIEPVAVEDPLRILLATVMIMLYSFGLAMAFGSLLPLFPSIRFLIAGAFVRPMFFLSGVFFTIDIIPEELRPYAALNPMLQMIELMRSAYFPGYESSYVHYPYLAGCILLTLFAGLLMQRALRRHAFTA